MSCSWLKNPIYVGGNAKSGTTLLACLIDNHPEIFCLPKEVPFKPLGLLLKPGDIAMETAQELLDLLERYIDVTFSTLKPFSEQQRTDNLMRFHDEILKNKAPENFKDVYEIIVRSAAKSYTPDNNSYKKWSFKNVGKRTYHHFLETYPDGKIVHIQRNPYGWILSRITSLQKKNRKVSQHSFFFIYRAIRDWRRFELYAARIQKKFGQGRMAIISYEDLVSDPENTLKNVLEFLELDAITEPLAPSVFKRLTSPDTARSTKSAIYTEAASDWKDQLLWHVKFIVSIVAHDYKRIGQKLFLSDR